MIKFEWVESSFKLFLVYNGKFQMMYLRLRPLNLPNQLSLIISNEFFLIFIDQIDNYLCLKPLFVSKTTKSVM